MQVCEILQCACAYMSARTQICTCMGTIQRHHLKKNSYHATVAGQKAQTFASWHPHASQQFNKPSHIYRRKVNLKMQQIG